MFFFFMNKTFKIKKADTTVPAFVISFHKVVAKDSYNSYLSLVFSCQLTRYEEISKGERRVISLSTRLLVSCQLFRRAKLFI